MTNLLCHSGTWGSLGSLSLWDSIGLILNLVFWVGLIAALILLVVLAVRRAQVPAGTALYATRQPTAKEILQAQYETMKQDIG